MVTEPPSFSTAATADLDAPQAENVSLVLISPEPSSRTPSLALLKTPAFTSASASIVAAASSLPTSMAAWTLSRLTSLSLRAKGEFLKPRFGSRRWSGIWPPSNPLMRTPERAVCPLPPRPPVLPEPEPMPRPMRWRLLRAPGRSESSCSFIVASSPFGVMPGLVPAMTKRPLLLVHQPHEVLHLRDHAARLRRIRHLGYAADMVEAQAHQRLTLTVVAADRAANLFELDQFATLAHVGIPRMRRLNRQPLRHRRHRGG